MRNRRTRADPAENGSVYYCLTHVLSPPPTPLVGCRRRPESRGGFLMPSTYPADFKGAVRTFVSSIDIGQPPLHLASAAGMGCSHQHDVIAVPLSHHPCK